MSHPNSSCSSSFATMNAAMRSARYGRVKKPAKTLKAPPTPKAVREAPVERDGVQVALPLGSIKNFQHFHNAPLSVTKHAKAIPSPKAKARKRAQVAEDVPPVKLDEAPPPPIRTPAAPQTRPMPEKRQRPSVLQQTNDCRRNRRGCVIFSAN